MEAGTRERTWSSTWKDLACTTVRMNENGGGDMIRSRRLHDRELVGLSLDSDSDVSHRSPNRSGEPLMVGRGRAPTEIPRIPCASSAGFREPSREFESSERI